MKSLSSLQEMWELQSGHRPDDDEVYQCVVSILKERHGGSLSLVLSSMFPEGETTISKLGLLLDMIDLLVLLEQNI